MLTKVTTLLLWMCALCCFLAFHAGVLRRAKALRPVAWAERRLANSMPALTAIGIALAVTFGLFMRLYLFPAFPGGVNQDGAMAASDAMALARYGTDRLGTPWPAHLEGWGRGQMSALLSYLLAGMFKLFGVSKLTLRLPQMLLSLLSIAVGWDFARRTLGKRYGWIALCLLLINPWHIMQSRWTIDCALFPHFFLLGAYGLLRGYEHKAWFYGAMVCFALCMYSYGIALYTVPPFLVAAVIVLLCQRRIRWYDALGCAALYLLLSAPFLAVMLLNYTGGETYKLFGLTIQFFEKSERSAEIVLMQERWYPGFVRNTQHMLNVLLYQSDGLKSDQFLYLSLPEHGSNYLFALPLILCGIAALIADRMQKRVPWLKPETESAQKARWGMLLLILWLIFGMWSALITDSVHLGKAAILMYPVIFAIAYAVYRVGKKQRLLAAVIAVAFAVGGVRFGMAYFSPDMRHKLDRTYYAGFVEALEASRDRAFDTLYVTQTLPEENQYGMPEEVLIEYAHRLDAAYMQGKKTVTDADGRVRLPFAERYRLADLSKLPIDPEREALYLVFETDLERFDPAEFLRERFGDYYLVTPKANDD